jgi:GTP cyclohydrolase II
MKDEESLTITNKACARIPTDQGEFQLCVYRNNQDGKEHLALIMGEAAGKSGLLARIHSECFTGDVLGSRRCDCGEQLNLAMKMIAAEGEGVLIYLRQEGRGIGLLEKLRAYNLQDQGFDTVEANLMLGHQPDERDYTMAARILEDLGVRSVRLVTNNPLKIAHLQNLGVPVVERVPLQPTVTADNADYLFTKVRRMNHLLNLNLMHVEVGERGNGSH